MTDLSRYRRADAGNPVCEDCGCVVVDIDAHDRFHVELLHVAVAAAGLRTGGPLPSRPAPLNPICERPPWVDGPGDDL